MGNTSGRNMPWKSEHPEEQRWEFVRQLLQKKNSLASLCRRWSISRKTAYKWMARFRQRGRSGLGDGKRVAEHIHNRPRSIWLKRIRRWRARHPHWGAPKLRWALKGRFGGTGLPSEAAIGRWLRLWGLTRRPRRTPHKGPSLKRPKLTIPSQPNEVWTVDFKGWFRTGDGLRVDPLTIRDLKSRYVLAIVLFRRQNWQDCRRAFEKIFHTYGLPEVIRVDNGSPFGATGALGLTRLSAWWIKLGIRVEFIAPGRPDQNGAHEQFHRIYKQEVAEPAAASLRAQKVRTQRWVRHYNQERPHEGLGMRVPAELYHQSQRKLPPRIEPWRYEAGWESRLVKGKGMISFQGRGRFVGEAFEGERVGLRRTRVGVWEVYYGPLLVGELWDKDTTPGIRAAWFRRGRRR